MKILILTLTLFLLTTIEAFAYVRPLRVDLKPATQVMIQKQAHGALAAAGSNQVLSAHAGNTSSAAVTVTSFVAQPDVPRNLVITAGTSTPDVNDDCQIVVTGTNYRNATITETFETYEDQAEAMTGTKAFKTVTSVVFPASCEDGLFAATWSIGYGEKIGLSRCIDYAGNWVFSTAGGSYESTRATVVADADEIEKNTADFNGTMNSSNLFFSYFIENYRCN